MKSPDKTLEVLGWKAHFREQVTSEEARQCHPVRVMAVHRGKIDVTGAGFQRFISPYIPGAGPSDDHPTVGDWLLIDRDTFEPVRVLQRMNLFKRRAPGDPRKEQMIAANVDTLFIVASCNQDFSVARLERYLVLAREVGVNPVVVLTKTDLADDPEAFAAAARAIEPGLRVESVNGRDPASVARLAAWCGKGETVALLGSSGVGKSTLVNTLRGSDSIATQAIRAGDGTGRHTTTVREMHRLDGGGWLLDTPGMRELQLSDAATGISEVFDDFIIVAQHCRFSDCAHGVEPGCAVRAAIAEGKLTSARFDRWRKLAAEDNINPPHFKKRAPN
ncbi:MULTISPECIES: ribosome small subunit-dependent GTPase A [unclassified Sphingopyxis]|uniref:ribosome small subunit-dependent GTPase A n=1 Tax=unclassified Sphingopyxis TaxID=2614943 RepID=UPI002860327B|nr:MULTISPECIES: ribosome small subunit-dependent GTPase A [unclassified Sphingopyxis]MDR7059815.1 ribosome biogenesis GTPase [Sphingopyxis sp. BE235]MDR7180673.1 ribosome biogenesis GTPase [Sphingopyxis sp. BE249]